MHQNDWRITFMENIWRTSSIRALDTCWEIINQSYRCIKILHPRLNFKTMFLLPNKSKQSVKQTCSRSDPTVYGAWSLCGSPINGHETLLELDGRQLQWLPVTSIFLQNGEYPSSHTKCALYRWRVTAEDEVFFYEICSTIDHIYKRKLGEKIRHKALKKS